MTLSRPSAIVTLANRRLTAAEAGLLSLRVVLTRGTHDTAEIILWPQTKFASAQPGDTVNVQLGLRGEEEDVWSGIVTGVERNSHALIVTGQANTVALSRERKSQTYVGQTVADVVRDLASSIDVDTVDAPAELSYYAVDHRRTIWGHLLDLARLSGSEITCSAAGALRFLPERALPSSTRFRFGAELLSWRVGAAAVGTPPIFASHGSASEAGSEKWHWINPDPTSGAGGGQVVGAFHARSLAEALSTAVETRFTRAGVVGQVELVGQAALRVGDVFSLSDLESGDPGSLRALAVTHTVDGAHGFRTVARVEGAAV
jgi:hypothetical protein